MKIGLTFEGFEDNYIKIGTTYNPCNWCYGDLIWNDNETLLVSQNITRSELRDWMEGCDVPTHVHHSVRGMVVRVKGDKGTSYKPELERDNYKVYHTNGEGLITYQEAEEITRVLPDVTLYLHDSGMVCIHNFPCPVCKTRHAVFELSKGVFSPCWGCQEEGWQLTKSEVPRKRWFEFWK